MPIRRPSASAGHGHGQPTSGPSRSAHKSKDSSYINNLPSHTSPMHYSAASATPQQKIVQTLINRLKNKLPSNSGLPLDFIEADNPTMRAVEALVQLCRDSLDIIAYSLSGLLETLAKADPQGQLSVEVLQSQLFVMKVLSMALAAPTGETGRFSPKAPPNKKVRGTPANAPGKRMEPFPLDERCAEYILSVIMLYLRQTSPSETRLVSTAILSLDSSFYDFESVDVPTSAPAADMFTYDATPETTLVPKASALTVASAASGATSASTPIPVVPHFFDFNRTHMSLVKSSLSLNNQIGKYAGLIIRHLSASNWPVVFTRIRNKLDTLASTSEEKPDTIDLQLMTHSAMDRVKLVQVLQVLSSLLVNMKQGVQVAIARPLRQAIWNWIDIFTDEFNDAIRNRGRMEGAPERTFEVLYSMRTGAEKEMWPTLTLLSCISSEHLSRDFQITHFGSGHYGAQKIPGKGHKFIEEVIKHANTSSKLSEVALVCALDMCKVAWNVNSEGEVPLRMIGADIAHEIKAALYKTQGRPFWESTEDIDVGIYAEALAAIFRFIPEVDSIPLFVTCLEPHRSEAVKIAVARAGAMLALEAFIDRSPQPLVNLAMATARRFRDMYKAAAGWRHEIDKYGNTKRASSRPKARRYVSDAHSDRELLLLSILALWRTNPHMHMSDYNVSDVEEFLGGSLRVYGAPVDNSIKISFATSLHLICDVLFILVPTDPYFDLTTKYIEIGAPGTLIALMTNLLAVRTDLEGQRLWISDAHRFISFYCRRSEAPHVKKIQHYSGRVPAFALSEIVLLVTLTSADKGVAHLAAQALRYIALAEMQPGAPSNPGISEIERRQRHNVYVQLGDPNVIVIGRAEQQKRTRKLIRSLTSQSAMNVAVWQECYWRWNDLCANIVQSPLGASDDTYPRREQQISREEDLVQWRHLTLFMAAFSGVCAQDDYDPSAMQDFVPPLYLPDDMRILKNPMVMVTRFIKELTDLLIAESAKVREIAREALGTELNPLLYGVLFGHLEQVTHDITEGAKQELSESFGTFLDQFTVVLKMLVEKQDVPPEEVQGIDISPTLVALTGFIARFNNPVAHRIRLKLCALCDCVCERTDTLTLRKDTTARQTIIDTLMDWIQDPTLTMDVDVATDQINLNMACIRTTVKLMENLDLRSSDGPNADSPGHAVSRLFIRYFNVLLQGLQTCQQGVLPQGNAYDVPFPQRKVPSSQREADLHELIVTGLAHLIHANTEIGVKHCLPLAHDPDVRKRTIFARVFARVLKQGTKFESLRISHIPQQSPLCQLVKAPDMLLALAICDICPSSDVDVIISLLMNLYDTRTSLVNLLKFMIDREIAHTDSDAALFRGNSTTTRFLSAFAKIHGYNYLRSLILPLVNMMAKMPPGHGYELNPDKAIGQDVKQNQRNVEAIASGFLDIISLSVPTIPQMFREICAHIAKSVQEYWPESKFAALGAFIFLRFISPAVVAPEVVDVEVPAQDNMIIRKGLMVIAKVIQNLANNIFFGKEAHMVVLNDFLRDHIVDITRYLSEVNKYSAAAAAADEAADEWLGTTADKTDTIVLHRFFAKYGDKIGKELLSQGKAANEEDSTPNAKDAWIELCNARVGMGDPLKVPELSSLIRDDHESYLDLMTRYAHRNTDSIRDIFIETNLPEDHDAMFVLRICKIDVEAMDVELFMFHIFKTLALPKYESRTFSIILDCTAFTSASEMPVPWLINCTELIPLDIRERFKTTYILNPNALTQRYLRRLYNICAGTPFSGSTRAYSTVAELLEHIPEECASSLSHAVALEDERMDVFTEATMRQSHQMRMPVTLAVGVTHIRITSVKAQPLSPALACKATEIIYLKDVNDIYNVSTGQDPYEFIIRRIRQGVTLYFSSSMRETIVKTIRTAKSQMKDGQLALVDRGLQFANVSATLLNIGMLGIDSEEEELRNAAYDLLGAICKHIGFGKHPMIACEAGFIPEDPNTFIVQLSQQLASFAPQLTLDFITEVASGMDKAMPPQRINCLQYMKPWIPNLAMFCDPSSPHYEHSGAKLRDVIRLLVDLTTADHGILSMIQNFVWSGVAPLDITLVNVVLDELMRAAIDGGVGSKRCEVVARTVATLSSVNVRGRIFSKLRKILAKTALKPTRNLIDNYHWSEIAALTRLAFVATNHSKQALHTQLYMPEIVHLVTLISGTGPTLVRKSVYGIILNFLQSVYATRSDDDELLNVLLLIEEFTQPHILRLFGLARANTSSEYSDLDPASDRCFLDIQESLTALLIRVMEATSGSAGLLNVWRARWIGLIASMAFQHSPAIQSRAFIALGALASSDVDDDFMYQILVAFKVAMAKCSETETASVVCMLRCIYKVVPALSPGSKYTGPLFWLAVALLQSSHIAFYPQATELLQQTLEVLEANTAFYGRTVPEVLFDARMHLEETLDQLDQLLNLSFDGNFSFSLAAIIFKGVRIAGLKGFAEPVLRSLLRITVQCNPPAEQTISGFINPDALGYFIALVPLSNTPQNFERLVMDSNVPGDWDVDQDGGVPRISVDFLGVEDETVALLIVSFVGAMISNAQGDDAETEMLYTLLSDVGAAFPSIVAMAYDGLQDRIKETFANSSNPNIIKAVSEIFRIALADSDRLTALRNSQSTIGTIDESPHGPSKLHLMALDELGMRGLASSFQFLSPGRGHATKLLNWIPELVTKILEA